METDQKVKSNLFLLNSSLSLFSIIPLSLLYFVINIISSMKRGAKANVCVFISVIGLCFFLDRPTALFRFQPTILHFHTIIVVIVIPWPLNLDPSIK